MARGAMARHLLKARIETPDWEGFRFNPQRSDNHNHIYIYTHE